MFFKVQKWCCPIGKVVINWFRFLCFGFRFVHVWVHGFSTLDQLRRQNKLDDTVCCFSRKSWHQFSPRVMHAWCTALLNRSVFHLSALIAKLTLFLIFFPSISIASHFAYRQGTRPPEGVYLKRKRNTINCLSYVGFWNRFIKKTKIEDGSLVVWHGT